MKKKKKKSGSAPKKSARRAAAATMNRAKKGPAGKTKKTKPKSGKKAKKAASSSAMRAASSVTVPICSQNFTTANNSQVCFTGIPSGGCTLSQIAGNVYPFRPVTGTQDGLEYTNLSPGNNCVTVVVPAINQTYPYSVSCCSGRAPGHSVTVNS